LLQRELTIVFHGTDKSGSAAVATVQHPKGNIAGEILKNGLGRMADWSVRLMDPAAVPPLRMAENTAKKAKKGIWTYYEPPKLSGAAEISGTVLEVISGDTVVILPQGVIYDSEDALEKVSLASIRSPRLGNERSGRADEPYAYECKEKLRSLVAGKPVTVQIHYEREIPLSSENNETRRFGTISVGKKDDVSEVLVLEGLATTQRHRDEDEKSPRYDELRAAEALAKAGKKGMHKGGEYKRSPVNDLTDPRKALGYASTLERNGVMKGIVEFCFNGARFKIYIPSENCYIMFAPNLIRCPQPSPSGNAAKQGKKAEPFGDAAKRHARMALLQRTVDITCPGITKGGLFTGTLHIGQGAQRRDYCLELVMAGLATVDQRKIDYGEAPKMIVDAQNKASKLGVWSIEREVTTTDDKPAEKASIKTVKVKLSEIRSGSHFFFQMADDEAGGAMDSSMKAFTEANGTDGAECDMKVGNVVAALFDDGSGKRWYRAKLTERANNGKVKVLFIDYGNVASVPVASHLRPLDENLGTDKIPAIAKEASLALTVTRALDTDEGLDAARFLQDMAWGKEMSCSMYGPDDNNRLAVALEDPSGGETLNEQMVAAGLGRVVKKEAANALSRRMVDGSPVYDLSKKLMAAQERARTSRSGMWRYGDIGDDDDFDGY
jgi:staphylococcal nuclease domain-containing protein 1